MRAIDLRGPMGRMFVISSLVSWPCQGNHARLAASAWIAEKSLACRIHDVAAGRNSRRRQGTPLGGGTQRQRPKRTAAMKSAKEEQPVSVTIELDGDVRPIARTLGARPMERLPGRPIVQAQCP